MNDFCKLKFLMVENRLNSEINCAINSCAIANVDLDVISEIDAKSNYSTFSKNYRHFSSNSESFELICFRRYFLISDYLEKNESVKEFVLIDSDVLVFEGVDTFIRNNFSENWFSGSILTFLIDHHRQISPHASYWKREALFDFVNYLIDSYVKEDFLAKLSSIQNDFISRGERGGVSDMTLLYLWAKDKNLLTPINTAMPNGVIDHNINIADGTKKLEFETSFGVKRIRFSSKSCELIDCNQQWRKVYILHFQGKAKILMASVLNRNSYKFLVLASIVSIGKKVMKFKYRLFK